MHFETEDQIQDFVQRFENGQIPAGEWNHAAHVAIAAIYVWELDGAAFPRIRAGIHHLNWHHGTISTDDRGYHETLTVFWTDVLRAYCRAHREERRLAVVNGAVRSLPVSLHKEYYSFDVIRSRDARRNWIAPDLKAIAV